MTAYLLSLPNSPLSCGVMCHPSPEPEYCRNMTKPSLWHLASHDTFFTDAKIAEMRQIFEKKGGVEYHDYVHPGSSTVKTSHSDNADLGLYTQRQLMGTLVDRIWDMSLPRRHSRRPVTARLRSSERHLLAGSEGEKGVQQ